MALDRVESREWLARFAVDHAGDAIFWADMKQRIVYANATACRSLGYTTDEVCSLSISDLVSGHDSGRYARRLTQLKQGEVVCYESQHRRKDGSIFPVEVSLNYLDHEGEEYICAIARDITERKQVEEALQASDTRFRSLIETAGSAIIGLSLDYRIQTWNQAAEQLYGWPRTEVLGKDYLELFLPESVRSQVVADMQRVLAGQSTRGFENAIRTREGQDRILLWNVDRLLDPEGHPVGVLAVGQDVTAHKQAEMALTESEERFRQLAEHIREVFWLSDVAKNAILYISPGYETIWGRSCESLYASPRSWLEAIHPEDRERILQAALTKQVSGTYDEEYRIVKPDGSIRWIRDRAFPIRDGEGRVCRLAGVADDITARKQAKEALRLAHEELERRVEERTAALNESQQRLELAFHGAGLASWDWKIKSGPMLFNERWAHLRGFSLDEVKHHAAQWSSGVHPEDWPRVEQVLNDCLAGRRVEYEAEMRVRTKADEWTWVLDRGRVIERDAQGEPLRMVGIEIDITARKRGEHELQRAQAFVMSVLENIPNMVFVKDAKDLRFVQFNKAGEELLGYSRDELIGKNDYDFFPRDEADFFTQKDREVLESGRLLDIPNEPIQTRQRGVRILHTKKIPLYDEKGKPRYLLGISEDITERKLVEEALRASEERYSSLVSQAADIIYTAGPDGRFTFVNAAACSVMQYPERELLGKHYLELIRLDYREAAQRFYKQQVAERTPSTYYEFPALTHSGQEVWFGQRVQLRFIDGQIVGVEAIARDITARRQAEHALEERARCAAFAAEVSLLLNRDESLDHQLQRCAEAAVCHLGVAFTRVWLREPGDLCAACFKAASCTDRTECLHLHASAGLSTNLEGEYRRIPIGELKIGRIAQGEGPLFTNDVVHDDRLPNKSWMHDNGLHSFAGFPLIVEGNVFGVLALFGRTAISEAMRQTIESVCNGLATAIARKRAESELQSAYDRLQDVTRQVAEAQEAERRRIARELHDEFGQALTGLKFDVAWLAKKLSSKTLQADPASLTAKTQAMLQSVDRLIQSVRETAAALRPSVLDDLGLVAAIEWLVTSFRDRTGLPCALTIDPYIQGLSIEPEVATTVFRGAQELLTNVMRHAKASTLSVELSIEGDRLSLKVCDDGRGIQQRELERARSLGLRGLHERVRLIGGTVTIVGTPGVGTVATLVFPLHLGAAQTAKEPS